MRVSISAWLLAGVLGCAHPPAPRAPEAVPLEKELLAELNRLRADPRTYIPVLEEYRKGFEGTRKYLPGNVILLTVEGVAPVDEAIAYLEKARALHAFELSAGMSRAAADHVRDLGPQGKVGHYGTDGGSPAERLRRYGEPKRSVAENIGFGDRGAQNMVLLLLVDDGVPDRGHRLKMFSDRFSKVGIACGPHTVYRYMCVIDFAEDFVEE